MQVLALAVALVVGICGEACGQGDVPSHSALLVGYRLPADRVRRGIADDDDRRWLAWYAQLEARAMALLPVTKEGAA